jgi:hypothetical protein
MPKETLASDALCPIHLSTNTLPRFLPTGFSEAIFKSRETGSQIGIIKTLY